MEIMFDHAFASTGNAGGFIHRHSADGAVYEAVGVLINGSLVQLLRLFWSEGFQMKRSNVLFARAH